MVKQTDGVAFEAFKKILQNKEIVQQMFKGDANEAYENFMQNGAEKFFKNYQMFVKGQEDNKKAALDLFAERYDDVIE